MSAIPAKFHAALLQIGNPLERVRTAREAKAPAPAPMQRQPVGNPFLRRFALHRALGLFMASTGLMEARQGAGYHRVLHRLRLLDRLPASWDPEPLVEALPLQGSRPVPPSPDLPDGIEGPWPQTPVLDPGLYPPVMNLPRDEELRHLSFNVLRYLGQATTTLPRAMWLAAKRRRIADLDDAEFA